MIADKELKLIQSRNMFMELSPELQDVIVYLMFSLKQITKESPQEKRFKALSPKLQKTLLKIADILQEEQDVV